MYLAAYVPHDKRQYTLYTQYFTAFVLRDTGARCYSFVPMRSANSVYAWPISVGKRGLCDVPLAPLPAAGTSAWIVYATLGISALEEGHARHAQLDRTKTNRVRARANQTILNLTFNSLGARQCSTARVKLDIRVHLFLTLIHAQHVGMEREIMVL